MNCSEGHGLQPIDLRPPKFVVENAEVGVPVVIWFHRHLAIGTLEMVGLCSKTTGLSARTALSEVKLYERAKRIYHVQI